MWRCHPMNADVKDMVWNADLTRGEKFVLLAFVRPEDFTGCVSTATCKGVARRTGYTYRQVRRIVERLAAKGIMSQLIDSTWRIHVDVLSALPKPKERNRRKGFDYKKVFMAIGRRDGFFCQQCGDHGSSLQIDHIRPVSKGGTNALENLQILCARCNHVKSDHWDGHE